MANFIIKRIMPVPDAQEVLDKAFRRTKHKKTDLDKVNSFCSTISSDLKKICSEFPNIDELHEFYKQLIEYNIGIFQLKKSLNSINWASKKVLQISGRVKDKRAVFGRVSSVVNKVSKDLKFLNNARRSFDSFPKLKDMFTVCITGFPNVGKTTLLSKLTKSLPEIKAYPFTTKRLNIAYLFKDSAEIQFLDTPGTLNRINKMNRIELQSFLAMRLVSNFIVFVFDPTYDIDAQLSLLAKVLKYKKPVVVFVSKSDVVDDSVLSFVQNKLPEDIKVVEDPKKLERILINSSLNYYKELLKV